VPGPLMFPRAEDEEDLHAEADHVAEEAVAAEDDAGGMLRLLIAVSVPALLLLGGFAWWMMPKDRGQQNPGPVAGNGPTSAAGAKTGDTGKPAATPAPSLAVEVDTVTKNFLTAKTVEEMLRWVRLPEQTAPKVEKWLAGEAYKPPGLSEMLGEYRYGVEKGREVIAVPVRTGDYEQRDLMLVREPGGLRADWEAWVAWSEMSWEQFRQEKPQEPKAFRVVVTESDYFNFLFKDEAKWSGYRLTSLDGVQSIFGYAARGTELNSQLGVLISPGTKKLFLLRLKYPPDARVDNQVEIVDLISESWVDLSTVAPPP